MQYKVRVIMSAGRQSVIGMMDPKVGMVTNFGTIAAVDASSGICTMGDTATHLHGGRQRYYAHQLYILVSVATSNGWPNAADCVVFGHKNAGTIRDAESENPKSYTVLGPGGVPQQRTHPK